MKKTSRNVERSTTTTQIDREAIDANIDRYITPLIVQFHERTLQSRIRIASRKSAGHARLGLQPLLGRRLRHSPETFIWSVKFIVPYYARRSRLPAAGDRASARTELM